MIGNDLVLKKNYQKAIGRTILGTHTELGKFCLSNSENGSILVGPKKVFEAMMAKIFPNLMKTINPWMREA